MYCRLHFGHVMTRRRGVVLLLTLVLLVLLFALFAVTINRTWLTGTRTELQIVADAAALAAAQTLVADDLLRADPALIPNLLNQSRAQALAAAAQNPIHGQPFALDPNLNNLADGDIAFGIFDQPLSKQFNVPAPADADLVKINAVRVLVRRTRVRGNPVRLFFPQFTAVSTADVQAAALAMLDRDVLGFQPLFGQPLPLAPLALLSDYTGAEPRSWQFQVEVDRTQDTYRFDAPSKMFVFDANGDKLAELKAVFPLESGQLNQGNVTALFLGASTYDQVSQQLQLGVTVADLANLGGQFVLGNNNTLTVDGAQIGPGTASTALGKLKAALEQLQKDASPRIWPLSCGFDAMSQKVTVCGFVAARVVTVEAVTTGQPFRFTLQPTLISTGTAVTNASRRGINNVAITNPYVCKVRFVE